MAVFHFLWSLIWHRVAAYVLLGVICLKAWFSYDASWDSWWYHIPFAARLWGIVPAEQYQMEPLIEQYYQGLPLLSEWLQGMFWWLTGRVQATNLLAAGCFVFFVMGVARFFVLPITVFLAALLAIPVVQAHITSSYVDLPGNLALAAAFLMLWHWLIQANGVTYKQVSIFLLCLTFAANSKFQFLPTALLAGFLFVLLYFYKIRVEAWRPSRRLVLFISVLFTVFMMAAAYVPVRNSIQFGNPLHPLIIRTETPEKLLPNVLDGMHLMKNFTFMQWLPSVFEWDRPYGFWSIDQLYFYPEEARSEKHNYSFRGGYNWIYVLGQLVLFVCLLRKLPFDARRKTALLFLLMTLLAAWLPRTQELRYYMFWMIWLVSVNIVLLTRMISTQKQDALVKCYYGSMCAIAVYFMQGHAIWAYHKTFDDVVRSISRQTHGFSYLSRNMHPKWILFAKEHGTACIVRQQPFTFFYTSYFNDAAPYKIHSEYVYGNCAKGTLPPRDDN